MSSDRTIFHRRAMVPSLSAVALAPLVAEVEVHETRARPRVVAPGRDAEIQGAWLRFLDRRVPTR